MLHTQYTVFDFCNMPPTSCSIQLMVFSIFISPSTGASDLFRSVSAKLKDSTSSDLVAVSASLYAKSLITFQLHQEMTGAHGSSSNKAAKLIDVLQDSLDTHTNPEAYLNEVCSALKDVGEKQIVDVVNRLERTCKLNTCLIIVHVCNNHARLV